MPYPTYLSRQNLQWLGLFAGPLLFILAYALLPETYPGPGNELVTFTPAGRITAGLAAWMAAWWLTEAIPIPGTALLPIAILPITGAMPIGDVTRHYGHELIFLFLGGFMLALAMERWGLHRRIALTTLRMFGTRPINIVAGFMLTTAVLSMWVSNTATAVMMVPIAISVIDLVLRHHTGATLSAMGELPEGPSRNFAICVLLGIAYSASIGGIGTLIGTPPNLFLASYIEQHFDQKIDFAQWMAIGIPFVAVYLPLIWLLLTRVIYPIRLPDITGGKDLTQRLYRELGPLSRGEKATFLVFVCTAGAWVSRSLLAGIEVMGVRPLEHLTDAGIAIMAVMAMFMIPVQRKPRISVMDWESTRKLPWGILILFGGGLALGSALQTTGVGAFLGHQVEGFRGLPIPLVIVMVTGLMILLTEVTSNTATTATLVPILAGIAPGLDIHPFMLIVPAAIAASCAFMMPVATPPNAIVFASGYLRIGHMVRVGTRLYLISIALVVLVAYLIAAPVLGIR